MLIDQLVEDQRRVDECRRALGDALANRAQTVKDMRSVKLPVNTIAGITGLHPSRIKIIAGKKLGGESPQLDSAAT
jgi:hypothetical protein